MYGWIVQWNGYSAGLILVVSMSAVAAGSKMLVSNCFALLGSVGPVPLVTV
jgi:hypothetical protein